jgi:hypothetical protein
MRQSIVAPASPKQFSYTLPGIVHGECAVHFLPAGPESRLVASGWTVQMLMNLEREVLVAWPEYMEEFRRKWKAG